MKLCSKIVTKFLGLALVVCALSTAQVQAKNVDVQVNIHRAFVPSVVVPNTEAQVVVSGMFPNSCYAWNRSEVQHIDEFTHEVRAYATVKAGMCLQVLVPFSEEVALGQLSAGKHTLRLINGDETYSEKSFQVK